ncbi:MAG: 3-hydroxybutyryl-CoA dehydrogenase [Phycisphaerae bacterium]|nr:3-hydroxybutyryl-CoA dehydrogenase [Phycisphaerae bacterium]
MSDVKSIAVIGAGTMGSGIALTAASSGFNTRLIDINQEQVQRARGYHAKTLDRNVEKERMTREEADATLARIEYQDSIASASGSDWGIEAATENIEVKKQLFAAMADALDPGAVLATNTSSISITDIAASVPSASDRVIGMHFFNPVPVMKLVEVINGLQTSPETTERTIALAESMGKSPIPANDRAGFVSNRVLMPMINEAFYAWMEGVAEPEAIDGIMKLGCNFPMGPLRLADFIGLDVCYHIMMVLHGELGDQKYFPCPKLHQLVTAGRLGNKTGAGVYDYDK